jgi:adenylosuccinate synthase
VTFHTAVIGFGFGDEGKGRVVDDLCANAARPLVVRFSGGHQAAHHVVLPDGREHVFASFGSGTLRGAPTFWAHFCPVNPPAFMLEREILHSKGVAPVIEIDARSPITTPYDIASNRKNGAAALGHGSCGVGIFATWQREQTGPRLWFEDLFHPAVLRQRLCQIADFYNIFIPGEPERFLASCDRMARSPNVLLSRGLAHFLGRHDPLRDADVIWEGSQGLLLDAEYGFFPHVTPSRTGLTHVRALLGQDPDEVWLVTRAYHTRHGNGPMGPEVPHAIAVNPWERNADEWPQGTFRRTLLNLDLVRYAATKDAGIRDAISRSLAVTCMDLMGQERRYVEGGEIRTAPSEQAFLSTICKAAGAHHLFVSRGASGPLEEVLE